ncbi:BTB/POZ domain-containing protein 9-like isoform X2 [Littorina saxatilis]|uniref:BTB/POZ domain-containing protein 9 n=1 Tax=Littorina saxatilis TaxID=31220 RepID=A0AAN9BDI1_9CAEN
MCDHHHLRSPAPVGIVDHIVSLSENFGELVDSDEYADITLVVENTHFKGHKIILAARSEYFRALLYGGMKESLPGTTEINLPDTPALAFAALLKYMYTGRMNLTEIKEENLLDILGLAHRFVFVELETAISDYLKATLSLRNVCCIYDLANIYSLTSLCTVCKDFMDRHASDILTSDPFLSLSLMSVRDLILRDSFCAQEIDIFQAVCAWAEHNQGADPTHILEAVRLPLMTMNQLLNVVRDTGLVSSDSILDAIKLQTECRDMDLKYRGFLLPEDNVATTRHGAQVIRGEMKAALLDGDVQNYDLDRGFTRHPIDDNNGQGIAVKLGQPYIINTVKLLLWDRDMRSYSYYIEVSMDDKDYDRIIDHTGYLCRSWQKLHFPARVVRYIRVVGSHNTVNRVFHLVSLECLFTNKPFQLDQGLVVPIENVATIKNSACVIEGVSRSRNALINGETRQYDWDSGYTCHQLGSGAIVVQLAQPYMISTMRLLLWDCDDRSYSYYVEVSTDQQKWHRVADKSHDACKSWQTLGFDSRPVTFIRIVGTHNTANEVFHCVHFECPADTSMASLMHSVSSSGIGSSLTSGPPNSPHLAPRPSVSGHSSGPQMPIPEAEADRDDFYNPLPHSPRSGTPMGGERGSGASGGGAGAEGQNHHHHRHSSVSSNASSNSNLMGQPSPRLLAMDVYARPESQQDVPEADRMDTH